MRYDFRNIEPQLRVRADAASELLDRRPKPGMVWSALRDRIGVSVR
ncbi:hypothetical protein [Nocardia pseudovaccinii]|nr:hypothetical protein [Nocardia pseudovaccinii]